MTDHYSMIVVAWMFFLLIGMWVLVNALIDLGAKRVRKWFTDRLSDHHAVPSRVPIKRPDIR